MKGDPYFSLFNEFLILKMKSPEARVKKINKNSAINDFYDVTWAFVN
jgi:hypothetical protein